MQNSSSNMKSYSTHTLRDDPALATSPPTHPIQVVLVYSGRLHVPIVGPTGRSDWSVRLVGPSIVSCKRFVRPVGQTVGRIKHV